MSVSTPSSRILLTPPFSSASPTRLQALYSDFSRQKHSNPVSFQSNVEWWKKAFETIVSTGLQDEANTSAASSRLVLNSNSTLLNLVKVPKVGKPLALGTVLAELHTSNTFIPMADFMALKSPLYATSSLPVRIVSYAVGKPLWWALEQAGVVGDEGIFGSSSRDRHKGTAWYDDYVVVPLLEKAGDAIVEMQQDSLASPADAIYNWSSFSRTFANAVEGEPRDQLHKDDLKVLLKYLERDRGVLVYDKNLIKFVDPNATAEERAITPIDRGVLEVKSAVEAMHSQIDALQQRVDRCTQDASAALKQNRKPNALNHIRLRKQLQDVLSKRLSSLGNLESTLLTVESAMGDVEIMQSYKISTATLKSILAHPSLQRDNIDQTLEALAEANADAREIDEVVQIGGDVAMGAVTDDDVQDELDALVREIEGGDKKQRESHQRLLESEVPQHIPTRQADKTLVLAR